jgi:hypothetical protein
LTNLKGRTGEAAVEQLVLSHIPVSVDRREITDPKGKSANVAAMTRCVIVKRLIIRSKIMSGKVAIVILKEAGRRPRLLSGSLLILNKIPKQVRDDEKELFNLFIVATIFSFLVAPNKKATS